MIIVRLGPYSTSRAPASTSSAMVTPLHFFLPSAAGFFLLSIRVSGSSVDCCRLPPAGALAAPAPPLLLRSLKRVVAAAALLLAQLQMASKMRTTKPRARFTTLPFLKSGMAKPRQISAKANRSKKKKRKKKTN